MGHINLIITGTSPLIVPDSYISSVIETGFVIFKRVSARA